MKTIPIEHGKYYHIFNRGNNYEDIFRQKSDYLQFLNLMDIYITSIADVYAWALLGNHFHLLVRIKEENEIGFLNSANAKYDDLELKWRTYFPDFDISLSDTGGQGIVKISKQKDETILCPADESMSHKNMSNFKKKPKPTQNLKHFFNTYAKWYNRKYKRIGSLFIKNFERKLIDNERYLRNLIIYIHQNPIKHRFTKHILEYPWTSYLTLVSIKPTKLFRKKVLGYFNDVGNFKYIHKKEVYIDEIEQFIIE